VEKVDLFFSGGLQELNWNEGELFEMYEVEKSKGQVGMLHSVHVLVDYPFILS